MRAFISYSHKDAGALERLHVHLAALRREGRIDAWFDRDILAGSVLDDEISREIESAELFLLLISPDFIASDYCVEREMKRAMEKHNAGVARVVPIILQPCDWASVPSLRRLKALPKDGNPVSDWTNPNTAYLNIVHELRRVIDSQQTATTNTAVTRDASIVEGQDSGNPASRYRVQKTFDQIDRSEYRDAAFAIIKEYFRNATSEINSVDGLRGRFTDIGSTAFGSTVINRGRQGGTAHITVHSSKGRPSLGDIFFFLPRERRAKYGKWRLFNLNRRVRAISQVYYDRL